MNEPMSRDLPRRTVTFLFTDVEGSTKLLHRLGDAAFAGVTPYLVTQILLTATNRGKR